MSIVKQSLIAVALLSVAMVESAPVDSSSSPSKKTNKLASKSGQKSFGGSRRSKRNVLVEEVAEPSLGDDEETEEQILRDQLSELTNDQLAMLAEIVQNEVNRFDPNVETYQIVEIPEYVTRRDRRSVVVEPQFYELELPREDDVDEMLSNAEDGEEIVFIPEQVYLEAAAEAEAEQDALDEYELTERIAEIANILNERATRRLKYF